MNTTTPNTFTFTDYLAQSASQIGWLEFGVGLTFILILTGAFAVTFRVAEKRGQDRMARYVLHHRSNRQLRRDKRRLREN